MDSIKFDYSKICNFVTKEEMIALYPEARQALKSLKEGTGKGSDFLGWLNLPVESPLNSWQISRKRQPNLEHVLR